MDRRTFLRSTALAVGVTALGPPFWDRAYAATAQPGPGPYGALGAADGNGVMLPNGFTSRILATTGDVVAGTAYPWHPAPDGGAVFPQPDGGWVYTSNSEIPVGGGAGALRFGPDGEVSDAYRILTGTNQNCAGGPSPWGTWLSGEENPNGLMHECTVTGTSQGTPLPALGTFAHEAVTFDDGRGQLYLTEDTTDGRFYRFTPDAYPDLSSGLLEVMKVAADGAVTWLPALNPDQPQSANRVAEATAFDGGEGIWFDSDHVYFTTKGDNRVWDLDVPAQRLSVLYDAVAIGENAPLTGVDNLVVSRSGDIFVAEDGGNLEVVVITPDGVVAPVMRLVGHDASEITGPAFSPDGRRLYFSSQRGTDGRGVTFEVSGPFRVQRVAEPVRGQQPVPASTASPSPAPTTAAPQPAAQQLPATGASTVLAASAAAAVLSGVALRRAGSGGGEADGVSG